MLPGSRLLESIGLSSCPDNQSALTRKIRRLAPNQSNMNFNCFYFKLSNIRHYVENIVNANEQ